MDVNYELYKVFYYVAKTLSFSEAAKQLYVSQSAVSQSIRTLESKLNQSLFIRSTKKVALTPEGELLFLHIEPALNLIHRGEVQLAEHDVGSGQIRIGASDTICRYYLIPFLEKFHATYPSIHIKVTNSTSIGCVELLESGQVDLIVSNSPNSHLKGGTHIQKLSSFRDVFVANESYDYLKGKSVSLKELLKLPLLMLTKESTTSEYIHAFFQHHKLDLVPEIEVNSNDLLLDLAKIGLGVAIVPNYCLQKEHERLFVLETNHAFPTRELILAYKASTPLTKATTDFLQLF